VPICIFSTTSTEHYNSTCNNLTKADEYELGYTPQGTKLKKGYRSKILALSFKDNAEALSKWNEDLKSRLAKGDISQDIYNHYVSNASGFKSYNDDGEYNSFQELYL